MARLCCYNATRDQRKRQLEFHVTYRCDLRCRGCNRAGFLGQTHIPDMTLDTFTGTLEEIEELGFSKSILIIGGEPSLHPQCLEFLRVAKARGFEQSLWTNCYNDAAKELVKITEQEELAHAVRRTWKARGVPERFHKSTTWTVYCSPADCGMERAPCGWGAGCGPSVDELGITPCPIGGVMAAYVCSPKASTKTLRDLLSSDWLHQSFKELCKHCGAFMDDELRDRPEVTSINDTLMTKTWIDAFGVAVP